MLRARPRSAVRACRRRPAAAGASQSRPRTRPAFLPLGRSCRPFRAARRSGQGSCAGVAGRPGRPARAARARHRRPTVGRPVHHRRARRPLPAPRRDAGGGRRLRSEEVPSDHPVRALDATLHLDGSRLPRTTSPLSGSPGCTSGPEATRCSWSSACGPPPRAPRTRFPTPCATHRRQMPESRRRRAPAAGGRLRCACSRPACSWR